MTQQLIFERIANDLDTSDGALSHASLLNAILQAVARILKEGVQSIDVDTIVAGAKQAYDAYVAPVNIPGIPDFVEPSFDAAVWTALESGIRALYARIVA